MPAGRPKELTQEVLDKALDYAVNFKEYDDVVPSIAGLSCVINVARSTVYLWKEENEIFSDILCTVMQMQERALLNGGLSQDFNATITKLMLTKHGYADKQEVQQEVKEVKELSDFYSDSDS